MKGRRVGIAVGCLALAVALAGCPKKQTTYVPTPERSQGLPDDAASLIELSDRLAAEVDKPAARADRALAALEKAADAGPAQPIEVHWRLARAAVDMVASVSSGAQKLEYARAAAEHATRAVDLAGERVEGHYYLALAMAREAEARADAAPLKDMMKVAARAAALDETFDDGGPLRLMGKTYLAAPEWPASVGDREEAVATLKRAVSVSPTPLNRLFLGQAFYHAEETSKAEAQIRRALRDGRDGALARRFIAEGEDYLRRMGAAP